MTVSARALSPGSGFAVPRTGSAVADAADRGLDAGVGQALGVADRDILHAAIAMVHQAALAAGPPVVERLFQGIQDKAGLGRSRNPPARACPRAGEARPVGSAGQ